MENSPGTKREFKPFDWRTCAKNMSDEAAEALDMIAELAAQENIDFKKLEEDLRAARLANHPNSDPGEIKPVDRMVTWAYERKIVTDEELRKLQKELYK